MSTSFEDEKHQIKEKLRNLKHHFYISKSKDKYQLKLGKLLDSYPQLKEGDKNASKLIKKFNKKIKKLDSKLTKHYGGPEKSAIVE